MARKTGNIGRLCRIRPLIADHRSEASAVVLAGTDTASYREKEQRLLLLLNHAPPGWVTSSVNQVILHRSSAVAAPVAPHLVSPAVVSIASDARRAFFRHF
jgi:hypothetical protein